MTGWADPRARRSLGAAALLFALLIGGELYQNDEPLTAYNLLLELLNLGALVGCTVVTALLVLRVQTQEEETRLLRTDVEAVRVEGQRWREEMAAHVQELGAAMRRQFASWRLTAAEQDVALLLLKGFSHKEIARLRHTGEATIRQQAASLYQKAGLGGRAALAAYFLDDLLADAPPEAPRSGRSSGNAANRI